MDNHENNYCIFRTEKITEREDIAGRLAHNIRALETLNADRHITNIDLMPALASRTILERWDAIHAQNGSPKYRKDAVRAVELIMTFSPERAGSISTEKWSEECMRFSDTLFGRENMLSAHLHLDEKTPHVHIMVAPFFGRKLRASHWLNGRQMMSDLQSAFHAQVGTKFGLERGVKGSNRKHIPQKQLYKNSNALQQAVETALETLDKDTPERLKIEMPDLSFKLVTEAGRDKYVSEVKRLASATWKAALNREQARFRSLVQPLIEAAKQYPLVNADLIATKKQLQAVMNREIKIAADFKKLAEEYRDLPLEPIAERILGCKGRRVGASYEWETDEHKLVVTGPKFKDFKCSQGTLGGGAIDLVIHLMNFDFGKAVRYLAADFGQGIQGAINAHALRKAEDDIREALVNPHPLSFSEMLARWGARDDSRLSKARDYLIHQRHIPEKIVDAVIEKGDLWGNKFGSCVFAHRSLIGEIVGCSIRGTSTGFKQALGNKTSAWFNLGLPLNDKGEIVVVESPIDGLSFAAMEGFGERTILSTAGMSAPAPIIALNRPLILAQDADAAGEKQASAFWELLKNSSLTSRRVLPLSPHKDWNAAIQFLSSFQLQIHQPNTPLESTHHDHHNNGTVRSLKSGELTTQDEEASVGSLEFSEGRGHLR